MSCPNFLYQIKILDEALSQKRSGHFPEHETFLALLPF
jgi:hypothetical protein